jgi:hypothetical protein
MAIKSRKRIIVEHGKSATELLPLFLQGVTELYPLDKVSPGVVLSFLSDRKYFYASLVRYEGHHENKTVLTNACGDTLDAALEQLFQNWKSGTARASELRRALQKF